MVSHDHQKIAYPLVLSAYGLIVYLSKQEDPSTLLLFEIIWFVTPFPLGHSAFFVGPIINMHILNNLLKAWFFYHTSMLYIANFPLCREVL